MYRKNSVHSVRSYPWFWESTGGLETHPPRASRGTTVSLPLCPLTAAVQRWFPLCGGLQPPARKSSGGLPWFVSRQSGSGGLPERPLPTSHLLCLPSPSPSSETLTFMPEVLIPALFADTILSPHSTHTYSLVKRCCS